MKVILIAALLGVALAAPNNQPIKFRNLYKEPLAPIKSTNKGRIINGEIAEPHSIPYQAFLTVHSTHGSWYCGGSLIAEDWILTAGHCGYDATHATIVLGAQVPLTLEASQVEVESSEIIVHKGFDRNRILNDIALIKLATPVNFTDAIQVVALPKDDSDTYAGKIARVSGWGLTDRLGTSLSDELRYTDNPILTNKECDVSSEPIPDYQLCVSGKDGHGICSGDSGGPLTVDGVQVGIVSYVVGLCKEGYPSYYTRVSSFLDWIAEQSV